MDKYTNTFNILLLISSLWIAINISQTLNDNILTPPNRNKLLNDHTYYFQTHRYNFQFDFDNNDNNNIISNNSVNANYMSISIDNINIKVLFHMNTSSYIFNINNNISLNYDYDSDWNEVQTLVLTSPSQHHARTSDNNDIDEYIDAYNEDYFDDIEDIDPYFDDIFEEEAHALYSPIHKSGKFIGIKHPRSYYNAQRVCHHKYNGQLAYSNENINSQLYELCKQLTPDQPNACWITSNQYNNSCIQIIDNKISIDNKCNVAKSFICEIDTIPTTQTDTFIAIGIALNWDKANEYCHTRFDTELATILSLEENMNVSNICSSVSNGASCWIGLERPFDKWQDRNAVIYDNWNSNEPNNYVDDESCTEIIYNNGQWNDLPCRQSKYFICNYIGKDALTPPQDAIDGTASSRRRLRSSTTIPIYRYYQGHTRDHFYTQNAREIGQTRAGRMGRHGYRSEGTAFYLSQRRHSGMVPLYRYYKGGIIDHFYTTNRHEIGTTTRGRRGKHGYVYEGIIGYCYPRRKSGTVPLYRYWKGGRRGDHFYTRNSREIGTTRAGRVGRHGYRSEGTTCYVWSRRTSISRGKRTRHKQPRPNKRCPNILIERRRIRTRKSQKLGHINFENNMVISLDVTLRAWPRGHWINIIHCGNRNTIRQPALFVNRNGKYFHVVYGTTRNWNKLKNTGRIRLNKKYKIQWRIRRDRYDVYIDGKRWYSVRGRHRNHQRQQCYLGDPWHGHPNAIVENLKIVRGTDPNGGCRRRRKARRRRRSRKARRPRRRRRKRRRRRRKKSRYKWKCSNIKRSDHEQKICIRRRKAMIKRLGRRRARSRWLSMLRRWMKKGRKKGYSGFKGLGRGFRRGYEAGKRSVNAKLRKMRRPSGGMGMFNPPAIRLPKIRLRTVRPGRVPLPPRIQLVDLPTGGRGRGRGRGRRLIWDVEEDIDVYDYGDMENEKKCMLYKEDSVYEVCVGYGFVEIKKFTGRTERVSKGKDVGSLENIGYEYEKYKSMMNGDIEYVKDKMFGGSDYRDTHYLDVYEFLYDEMDNDKEQCFINLDIFDVCLNINEKNDIVVSIEEDYDENEYSFNFSDDGDWNEIDEIIGNDGGKSMEKCVRLLEAKMCVIYENGLKYKILLYKTAE